MKEKIAEQTSKVNAQFAEFNKVDRSYITDFTSKLKTIESAIIAHKDMWVGRWYTESYDVYKELSGKEDKNYRYSFDGFNKHIGQIAEIEIEKLLDEINEVYKQYLEFNEFLQTELSILLDTEGFESEISQLNKLANYEWKVRPRKIVDQIRPKAGGFGWDQLGGVMGEFNTPPHIEMAAQIASMISLIDSFKDYPKSVKRLIRQLEIKSGVVQASSIDSITKLDELCNRFHKVAIQLRNRYDNRETIKINDEYDVQDLMHALLKTLFDDIRPEEYSPSYAGKNTRIDFLLKEEKILIEIKKTRDNLKDDKVGSELLLDINRYKNHPDCETLYCFVYDPQSLISNPKGLENDLMKNTTEDLKVIVKIVP